jgi:hypothetical protein
MKEDARRQDNKGGVLFLFLNSQLIRSEGEGMPKQQQSVCAPARSTLLTGMKEGCVRRRRGRLVVGVVVGRLGLVGLVWPVGGRSPSSESLLLCPLRGAAAAANQTYPMPGSETKPKDPARPPTATQKGGDRYGIFLRNDDVFANAHFL